MGWRRTGIKAVWKKAINQIKIEGKRVFIIKIINVLLNILLHTLRVSDVSS